MTTNPPHSGAPSPRTTPPSPAAAPAPAPVPAAHLGPSGLSRTVLGSGPGLLLAHGAGGGFAANFGPVVQGLAERYRVVGPDLPGSGGTPRTGRPLELDALADDLVATAVEEGLESFAVSGYSLGTALAVRAAARHPRRVRALVLTAGFARPSPRFLLAARLWRRLLAEPERDRLAAYLFLSGLGSTTADGMDRAAVEAALEEAARTVPPGTDEQVALLETLDVREDLARLRMPVLAVSTTEDALVSPFHQRQLSEGIPGAVTVELPTGHLPFAERPAQWLDLQLEFLDGVLYGTDGAEGGQRS
ncbi:alpha/beta hydrolase [Streptomyces physcomitrii]|uniref:alpha/beta fold hydrolase n=1 Tax=Streptomyces physcomitrii TaxID=2724184 RepID=UPI0033D65F60